MATHIGDLLLPCTAARVYIIVIMTYLVGTRDIAPVRAIDAQACTEQYRNLPWTRVVPHDSRDRKVVDAGPYDAGLEI
jgi:hypothetical protein